MRIIGALGFLAVAAVVLLIDLPGTLRAVTAAIPVSNATPTLAAKAEGAAVFIKDDSTPEAGTFEGEVIISSDGQSDRTYPFAYPDLFRAAMTTPTRLSDNDPDAKYPDASPTQIAWQSCLMFDQGPSLTRDIQAQTVLRDFMACRMRSGGDGAAEDAVVGIVWPTNNQFPVTNLADLCAKEAMVWFEHIAAPEADVAICLAVGDTETSDVVVFERQGDKMIAIATRTGQTGRVWSLASHSARKSDALASYALRQSWRDVPDQRLQHLPAAFKQIEANTNKVRTDRNLAFVRAALHEDRITFHFQSKRDRAVDALINDGYQYGRIEDYAFFLLMNVLCHTREASALLDDQFDHPSYELAITRENGDPWRFSGLAARRCFKRDG